MALSDELSLKISVQHLESRAQSSSISECRWLIEYYKKNKLKFDVVIIRCWYFLRFQIDFQEVFFTGTFCRLKFVLVKTFVYTLWVCFQGGISQNPCYTTFARAAAMFLLGRTSDSADSYVKKWL